MIKTPTQPIHHPRPVDTGGATMSSQFTLRDTFAMYALMSLPMDIDYEYHAKYAPGMDKIMSDSVTMRAELAYAQADAMIAERAKTLKYKKQKRTE